MGNRDNPAFITGSLRHLTGSVTIRITGTIGIIKKKSKNFNLIKTACHDPLFSKIPNYSLNFYYVLLFSIYTFLGISFIFPFRLISKYSSRNCFVLFFSSRGRIMLPTIFQIKFLLSCDITLHSFNEFPCNHSL